MTTYIIIFVLLLVALIVYVGATNVINFMDGINGITAGYALAVLVPLGLLNTNCHELATNLTTNYSSIVSSDGVFVDQSLIVASIIAALVFCIFNFRPKGKAKCFAGDVGSIGIAFIMLFLLGNVIIKTGDITWLIFLLVYGVDGCLTIVHRIMLHENLGEAHRKHAYQIMANEYNDKDSNIETIPTDVFMNFNKDPNQQEEYSVLQGNLAKFFNNSGGD